MLETEGKPASSHSLSYIEFLSSQEFEMLTKGDKIRSYMEDLIPKIETWDANKVKTPPGYDGTLYYKKDSSSGKIQIVTEIYMPWTMSEIAALVYEADLTPKWVKASSRQTVKLISNPVPYIVSSTNYITFPWPLDDRWGNNKSIAFVGDSIDSICQSIWSHPKKEHKFFGKKVASKPKDATTIINHQTIRYYKLAEDGRVVNYELSDADLQTTTPQYLQNEIMKSTLPDEFVNLMKNYEQIHPLYTERVEANPEHYGQIEAWYDN